MNGKFGFWMLALAVLGTLSSAAIARVPRGIILIPVGQVEIQKGESGPWESVSRPTKLEPGQNVRTSDSSSANIIFSDGSKVELSPKAVFAVERTDTKEASFNLKVGKLKAYFAGIFSGRMNVRTPTAVASVRGTIFDISAGEGGASTLDVHEGHVEVSDGKGRNAVIGAEETVHVGANGMEQPHLVSLTDGRSQGAARPMAVRMELAKDQTRHLIEELRNRELKANEAQLGKSAVDAFGHRVRIEEYLLRPSNTEVRFLFLSLRSNRFDWGRMIEQFHAPIPNDLTQLPGVINGAFFAKTLPSNYMKYFELYETNTTDAIKETVTFGAPTLVNFAGFNGGQTLSLYYPSSIDHQQILSGPGIPGGSRTQFEVTQDYNISSPNAFVWKEYAVALDGSFAGDTNHLFGAFLIDPAITASVAAGGMAAGVPNACSGLCGLNDINHGGPLAVGLSQAPTTIATFPRGSGYADYLVTTRYADGSSVSAEKFLVSNTGDVLNFANPNVNTFTQEGNFNIEHVVSCTGTGANGMTGFQGRNIDVMIAPEIFSQTKRNTDTANSLNP